MNTPNESTPTLRDLGFYTAEEIAATTKSKRKRFAIGDARAPARRSSVCSATSSLIRLPGPARIWRSEPFGPMPRPAERDSFQQQVPAVPSRKRKGPPR